MPGVCHLEVRTYRHITVHLQNAVNLKGVFFCCRAVAPVMKKQGGGRVINIASVAGITGNGSSIAYCASKAGVISVTKSLARVLAPEATVNAIAPGLIDTRWLDGVARAAIGTGDLHG